MTALATGALGQLREWLGGAQPEFALVLGSGLGTLATVLADRRTLPYHGIPGFPLPAVEGHAGEFVAGRLNGRMVLCQSGRVHGYEGHEPAMVSLPVRLFASLGIPALIVTNAAGGIRPGIRPGSLMLIADHVNLTFRNPLVGPVVAGEQRFPDMSAPYDPALRALAREVARDLGIALEEGVYAAVPGPSYETPAEVRMLKRLGADAVGMSTVLEVVTARARGMRCLGFSVITNVAAGSGQEPLSHTEVMAAAAASGNRLRRLVEGVVGRAS